MHAQIVNRYSSRDGDMVIAEILFFVVLVGLTIWFFYLIVNNISLHKEAEADESDDHDDQEDAEEGRSVTLRLEDYPQWYATKDGRNRLGPYVSAALVRLANDGLLHPGDRVLPKGGRTWVRADEVDGLFPRTRRPAREEKYCFACGKALDKRAEICPGCGVRQPEESRPSGGRDRITAALLALLLGWLGLQHFYLGKTAAGVVSVLVCWSGIPAFIGLIDFCILIGMSDAAFNKLYNKPRNRNRRK